jgi:hypothetical protein
MRLSILLIVFAAACAPASNTAQNFRTGAEIVTYTFSEAQTFEEGSYTGSEASLRIIDGVYRITLGRGDNELWWGQWGDTLGDVVIDVDVEQTSERNENAFGVGCRMSGTVGQAISFDMPTSEATQEPTEAATEVTEATEVVTGEATESTNEESTETASEQVTEAITTEDTNEATQEATEAEATLEATAEATEGASSPVSSTRLTNAQVADGDGYLFLIQGNGSFAIMRSRNRALTPLVDWRASGEINQGAARNQLRAVCVEDYLAFYINGTFVADVRDGEYSSGQVALLGSAANRLGLRVDFDNLKVSEAELTS